MVTHPFHPLCGRRFDLVAYRQNWGEDRVFFHDDQGHLRAVSAAWTNLGSDDPFVRLSGGRSSFRTSDLLELASILAKLLEDLGDA